MDSLVEEYKDCQLGYQFLSALFHPDMMVRNDSSLYGCFGLLTAYESDGRYG